MKISEVIVVEGKNDIMAVKRAVDAFVVSTSGSGLNEKTLMMLETLHKERGIIILTDPDSPGEKIRALITERIPTAHHAFVKKKDCLLDGDVGIENAEPKVIQKALEGMITYNDGETDLLFTDLVDHGLVGEPASKMLREDLCDYLDLTYCNGKTLYKRLKLLNGTKNNLNEFMEVVHA